MNSISEPINVLSFIKNDRDRKRHSRAAWLGDAILAFYVRQVLWDETPVSRSDRGRLYSQATGNAILEKYANAKPNPGLITGDDFEAYLFYLHQQNRIEDVKQISRDLIQLAADVYKWPGLGNNCAFPPGDCASTG